MLTDIELKDALQQRAVKEGFLACGVASAQLPEEVGHSLHAWLESGMHGEMAYMQRNAALRGSGVEHVLQGANSVIVFAAAYLNGRQEADHFGVPANTVRVASYATGEDYHYVLREKLQPIVDWLAQERPNHAWRICIDSAPISERAYAVAAGLGFIGKNTMLINWMRGTYTLLAEIITTATITPDTPRVGTCGQCTRCIDACPTQAITNAGQIDAPKCISYLTIEKRSDLTFEEALSTKEWVFGCDICQDVCPYNKSPAELQIMELGRKIVSSTVSADILLEPKSNSQFERLFARSPILRAGRRRIHRLVQSKIVKGVNDEKSPMPLPVQLNQID